MGLLDVLLGKTNPVSMFVDSNRNAVHGAAAGFGRGTNIGDGLSFAAQGAQAGSPLDDQVRANEEEKTQRQDQINQTMKFLQAKFPDLAQAVTAGLPIGDAWNEAFKRSAPGYGASADAGFSLNPGEIRYDSTGKQIAAAPPKADDGSNPTLTSIYDANGREQKGYMKGGQFVPVGSPKATTERPEFNTNQANAAGFADRMFESDAIISDPKITKVMTDLGEHRGDLPLVGNFVASPEYQQADQAKRNFINATLRRESGAVISDGEFANANKQYFPQPGDSDAVLAQKAANRKSVTKAIARAAGTAYQMPDTTNYLDQPPESSGDPELDRALQQYGN